VFLTDEMVIPGVVGGNLSSQEYPSRVCEVMVLR
jgi:hypothetical protein